MVQGDIIIPERDLLGGKSIICNYSRLLFSNPTLVGHNNTNVNFKYNIPGG